MLQTEKKAIDNLLTSYISDHHLPGLSVAVVDHASVVLAQGYGLADVENSVPASADTVYRIASLSKPISATAAMRLVESEKLDLDVPVQKYCPSFSTKAVAHHNSRVARTSKRDPRLQKCQEGGPISKHRGLQEAGHGGDQQGFSSVLYLLPEKQFGVVILSNLEGQQNSSTFIALSRQIYDVVSSPN